MPNHVSNIAVFNGEVSSLEGLKISVPDVGNLAFKLAVHIAHKGFTPELKAIAELMDVDEARALIDALPIENLDEMVSTARSFNCEVSPYGENKDGSTFLFGRESVNDNRLGYLLTNPTCDIEVDWYATEAWYPAQMGVYVNGFNGSFNKAMTALNKPESVIDYASGYNDAVDRLGTKWGVYDVLARENEIVWYTAWSPLSEDAMNHFLDHIEHHTDATLEDFGCWEGGNGFWEMGALVEEDDEEGDSIVVFRVIDRGDTGGFYAYLDDTEEDEDFEAMAKVLEDIGLEYESDGNWYHPDMPEILRAIA